MSGHAGQWTPRGSAAADPGWSLVRSRVSHYAPLHSVPSGRKRAAKYTVVRKVIARINNIGAPRTKLSLSVETRSTQPCIPPESLNRVPASVGYDTRCYFNVRSKADISQLNLIITTRTEPGKGGNVSSAGWQVTLCDPMWHVSSLSGVATLRTAIHLLLNCNQRLQNIANLTR